MFRPASTKYFGVFSSARLAIDDEASASRVLWNSGGNARAAVVEEKEAKPQRSSDFTERMLAAVPLDYADWYEGRRRRGWQSKETYAEAMRLICRGRNVMQREVGGSDRHKVELSIKKRSKGEEVAILFDPREKGESVVIRRGIRMKYHRQCQQHMFVIRRDEKRKHRDKGMERRDSDEDLFP